jgi:hypothetical protein
MIPNHVEGAGGPPVERGVIEGFHVGLYSSLYCIPDHVILSRETSPESFVR